MESEGDRQCRALKLRRRRQIEENRARTPTERFLALCSLLDAVEAMAPTDELSQQRSQRVLARRGREKEEWRAYFRRLAAAERRESSPGDGSLGADAQ